MDRSEAEAIYDSGRDACVKVLLALANQVERLEGRVERLEGEVRELRRDSGNSSLPPSADPGAGKGRRKGRRSDRKPGAQPGHPGSGRGLLPIEYVDEVIEHLPGSCDRCGHPLTGLPTRGPVCRHQVAELPETAVRVTEHRLHRARCPGCGAITRAELPSEIGRGRFGPRLQGAVATLAAGFRLSRRQVVDLCGELFGMKIAVGTVDAIIGRQGVALREPQERLRDAVRGSPVICADETGWRQTGERRFLWGAFTDEVAVLRVAPSRHREEAEELLGETEAIVSSDRWWAYDHLDPARRQVCWSHLLRDFRFHAESPLPHQGEFGEACLGVAESVFEAWRGFQADGDRVRMRREISPLERELRSLCEAGRRKSVKTRYHRGLARNLIKVWPALWTFVDHEGVEPTNNRAERGLRHAVIYRKLSQGSHSTQGAIATERLLSAAISCRLQGRSLFAYLAEVAQATTSGRPAPALA
ncbi:MAG TPA: IS66 family transposase [Lacisediminihabitans sp.]|uniref:IS66 family transposase n=1 Tax=Lacisediminihabitans sp. TaxID=2787631 RepID=UPI002ED91441